MSERGHLRHVGFALDRDQTADHHTRLVSAKAGTWLATSATASSSITFAARMAIMDPRYLNSAIASSASTPPVIVIGANGALAAMSALDNMI